MPKSHFLGNATGDAGAEQQPADAAAPQSPAAQTPEQAYHDQVRAALLRNAQGNFDRIVHAADDGYSKQLKQRSDSLTKYMRRQQGSPRAGAVLLDPNEFMAGLALGMKDTDVAAALLNAHHVPYTEKMTKEVAADMRLMYRFPYGEGNMEVATQNPHAFADFFSNTPGMCPIVPAAAFFPPELKLAGMTHQQNVDFINLHESWHCRDTRNKITGMTKEEAEKMENESPQMAIGDPVKLQALATANRQESLADAGAAGDLIRKGADPKIIDGVIAWRGTASDTEHMTVGALQELRRRIDEMGVDKFRKLNDDQARALYNEVAEKGSMSSAVTEKIISYVSSTEEVREIKRDQAKTDPDMQKALDVMAPYKLPPAEGWPDNGVRPLTPDEQKIAEQVRTYNAEELLQDRAFKDAHKITPAALVKAYGEMQEDLRRKFDHDPDNPLWQARAVKLQESFVHVTSTLDYVGANAKRGVDIVKAEAGLSRFSFDPNASAAPAETAPEPGQQPQRHGKPPRLGDAAQTGAPADDATPATGALRARRPTPGM